MLENENRVIEQLRPFLRDQEAFGRLHADIHDLMEICAWFLEKMNALPKRALSPDELEALLIELDVQLVDHGLFHLQSLKAEIKSALENFPADAGIAKGLRGA